LQVLIPPGNIKERLREKTDNPFKVKNAILTYFKMFFLAATIDNSVLLPGSKPMQSFSCIPKIMENVDYRVRWARHREEEKQKVEDEKEKERGLCCLTLN
jgi:hypothetical protein